MAGWPRLPPERRLRACCWPRCTARVGGPPLARDWHPVWVSILVVLVILALVTTATEIITRTEPASLLLARRRWRHAWAGYLAAVRVHRSDAEAAVVAAQEWASLIDACATTRAASDAAAASTPAENGHVAPDPWPGTPPM